MDSAVLSEENRALKAALSERDCRIEYLEFEMAKLKQMIFGARSERLAILSDPGQLSLWPELAEDAAVASPVEFKTVIKSPAKGKPKRTALPEHLPREIVVLPLSAAERACPECGEERPLIGYESSERLDYVPAQLKVVETRREKCACASVPGSIGHRPSPAAGHRTGHPAAGAVGLCVDG
jgi:transposase